MVDRVNDSGNEVLRGVVEYNQDSDKYDIRTLQAPSNKSSFGDNMSESTHPITHISAQYGILEDIETFTGTNGTATTSDNMFLCTTTNDVGSYAVIRSKHPTVYREGQGLMSRFTAIFDSNAVANSLQFAGLFNVQDTIAFGYRGAASNVTASLTWREDL